MREQEKSPRKNRSCRSSGLRSLIEPRCLSQLSLTAGGGDGDEAVAARRSFYVKLPAQHLIKISVVKLDGSLFDVQIVRNCTVAELKQAVEEVFTTSPREDQGRISWSHVWGHFCLCYQGQKLINDKACIRKFGIQDGDQLHFIRHLTINHSPLNRRSTSRSCKQYLDLQSGSVVPEEKVQITPNSNNQQQNYDNTKSCPEAQDDLPVPEFKLAHFLKGLLSYSKLWGVSRRGSEGRSRPSRFSLQRLGGRPKMIQL